MLAALALALTAIAIDAAGHRYVTGHLKGQAVSGDGPGAVTFTSRGVTDGFIARCDSGEALLWARSLGVALGDETRGVALGPDGSVYVTGFFHGTATFSNPARSVAGRRSCQVPGPILVAARRCPEPQIRPASRKGTHHGDAWKRTDPTAVHARNHPAPDHHCDRRRCL